MVESKQRRRIFLNAGFLFSSVITNLLISTLFMPLIIFELGLSSWGSAALGQAVGLIASTIIVWGWPLEVQTKFARLGSHERNYAFAIALKSRLYLLPIGFGVCLGGWFLLDAADSNVFLAFSITTLISSFSNHFFFKGDFASHKIFFIETLPKALAQLLSMLALVATSNSAFFAIVNICLFLLIFSVAQRISGYFEAETFKSIRFIHVLVSLKETWPGVTASIASLAYMAAPTVFVSILYREALPIFAIYDRVIKLMSLGLGPIIGTLQVWISKSASLPNWHTAVKSVIRFTSFLCFFVFATYLIGSEIIINALSVGKIQPDFFLTLVSGSILVASFFSQVVGGGVLASLRRQSVVAGSALAGAAVTIAMIFPITSEFGIQGTFVTLLLSEIVVAGYQFVAWQRSRSEKTEASGK